MNISWNDPKQRRLYSAIIAVTVIALFVSWQVSRKEAVQEKPNVVRSIPGLGLLPELRIAMIKNRDLRVRVQILLDFDEYYLFSNYREVNSRVSEILFLWAGLTIKELQNMKSQDAIDFFLRKSHGLPDDMPVKGNPYLPANPWPHHFNNVKSRLLMLGNGRNIYDGTAYYDVSLDQFVIEGAISEAFLKEFKKFLAGREDARRFRNNFLVFVDETKGLRNLNETEKEKIKQL